MKTEFKLLQTRMLCGVALVVMGLSLLPVPAVDSTFTDANWSSMGGVPGANGRVHATAVDDAGNLYIGGDFTLVGNVIAHGIAKWDGTHWSALGSGIGDGMIYSVVYALAASGNDLYVGGNFKTAGSAAATNIAKWNGSSWTALGSGISTPPNDYASVSALVVLGDNVFAGGRFTTAGGIAATNIAKWDGSSWSALGSGMNGAVNALAVSGSAVYAGGTFTTADGSAANNIAKWNGSSWSALGSGIGRSTDIFVSVSALAVTGADLYAGGFFTTAGGIAATNVALWNGGNWSALASGIDSQSPVSALAVSGGDVYAGGAFATAGGSTVYNIAKWNGSSWSPLDSGIKDRRGYVEDLPVFALAVSGNNVYAGGWFTTAGGTTANNIAKWDGNRWFALGSGSGLNDGVRALAVLDNDLYAGGGFTTAGNAAANGIAKWNGKNWSALASGLVSPWSGPPFVAALAASESNLFAGGLFVRVDGIAATNIAQWDGDSWSPLRSGLDGTVWSLAVSGSDLYAGGFFTTAGGIAANYVAKWDGTNWSALGSGVGGGVDYTTVMALAVSGSDVYAGGRFTTAGGRAARNVAKWDGTNWLALGTGIGGGPPPTVTALAVSGSDLYVGGGFTRAGGITATNIAKWDGSKWSALGSGVGRVDGFTGNLTALAVSGGDLYAAGDFTDAGGIVASYIAKWDGNSWSALGSGMDGGVSALAVSGSDLYVGGEFKTAGGKVSSDIAHAYLLNLPALSVRRSGSDVEVSWPSADTAGFVLEQANTLTRSAGWIPNTTGVTEDGTHRSVTLRGMNSAQFFRLRKP